MDLPSAMAIILYLTVFYAMLMHVLSLHKASFSMGVPFTSMVALCGLKITASLRNIQDQETGLCVGILQEATRQAVLGAVLDAPNNNNYARAQVAVSGTVNGSAYVLADCWRTLKASICRTCLEIASASILGCLQWSKGQALNTGCFMRYSDTNFLNPIPSNGSSRGTIIVIVVAPVRSMIVLAIGAVSGVHFWKRMKIQKKEELQGM